MQEKYPSKLLVWIIQEISKITQAIAIAFDCLSEFEGKTLLLKTGHTSDTGLGEIKMKLT